jgi:hypothetical protein
MDGFEILASFDKEEQARLACNHVDGDWRPRVIPGESPSLANRESRFMGHVVLVIIA